MRLNDSFNSADRILIRVSVFVLFSLFLCPSTYASGPVFPIKDIISDRDAVLLASPNGEIIFSENADQMLIPASTLKILTSLAAIHHLGADYRFPTDFFIDENNNLFIKGYGDPLMISEEIVKIAEALKSHIPAINNIILDDTFFSKPLSIPGTIEASLQPYDAPNGALCVNFNTVNFKTEHQRIVSAEPQTPMLPLARKKIQAAHLTNGRILLTNNENDITRYAGEMFQYFFNQSGIDVRGEIRLGAVDDDSNHVKRIYHHTSSYTLRDTISRLLEYSNNFIANQLLLATGAAVSGPPATLEKGTRAALQYLANISGLNAVNASKIVSYVEGSGISRDNRISARIFLAVLSEFKPWHELMKHDDNEYYKTGTLNGINTRAGYIVSEKNELYPYVVFINTPQKTTDRVIEALKGLLPH